VTELDRALVAGDAGRVTGKPQERPDPEEIGIECLRAASAPASPDPSPDGGGQGDATASVPAGLIGSTAPGRAGRAGHHRAGRDGAPDPGQGVAGGFRARRGGVVPAPDTCWARA
jgi:hypothetical protein